VVAAGGIALEGLDNATVVKEVTTWKHMFDRAVLILDKPI
jgi:hypothetical protein